MKLPRHAQIWLPGYIASRYRDWARPASPRSKVWLTIADHFEPLWRTDSFEVAQQRVFQWRLKWPEIAERHRDSAREGIQLKSHRSLVTLEKP